MVDASGSARGDQYEVPPDTLPPALHAIVPLALLLVWGISLRQVRLRSMNDLGLVSVLPIPVFLVLFLLTVSFAIALRRPARTRLLALHVLVLVVLLYGLTAILEQESRFGSAWKHVGVITHLAEGGRVDPNIDAYFNWPGFFALGALATEVTGLRSALSLIGWAPVAFNLLAMPPLILFFRRASADPRVTWFGLWLFYSANWVGQDYLSPQALGFLLWLVILAVAFTWFLPVEKFRRRTTGVWFIVSATTPERPPAVQLVGLFAAVVVMFAVITAGHQLTPIAILVTVTALVLVGQLQLRFLPMLFLVILLAWLAHMTSAFLTGNLQSLLDTVGAVKSNLDQSVNDRLQGSKEHKAIVQIRLYSSAGILLLAGLGALRRRHSVRQRSDIAVAVVGASTLVLPVLQPYGGEILLRVFLFALPAVAFFIACLVFPTASAGHRRGTSVIVVLIACSLLAAFQFTRYGNERLDYFTPGDVTAVEALYDAAPPGSVVIAGSQNLPWRYRDYAAYDYRLITDLRTWRRSSRPDPSQLADELVRQFGSSGAYLVLTRSTEIGAELYYGKPGALSALAEHLRTLPEARSIYSGQDGSVFYIRNVEPA